MRLIMLPVLPPTSNVVHGIDQFLVYVQRFDIISQQNDSSSLVSPRHPATQMFVLRRSLRAYGSRMGDVIPLSQIRAPVDLVPRFFSA